MTRPGWFIFLQEADVALLVLEGRARQVDDEISAEHAQVGMPGRNAGEAEPDASADGDVDGHLAGGQAGVEVLQRPPGEVTGVACATARTSIHVSTGLSSRNATGGTTNGLVGSTV